MPQHRPTEYTPIRPAQNEFPVWYSFYGTLTDPQKLKDLLALPSVDEPILRPAHVKHGTIKLLKQNYRALIDGGPGDTVSGCAYHVQTEEQEDALRTYETAMYEVVRCKIAFQDGELGEEVLG
ncbi:hypothetical protein LTS18_014146, partial [Coniosporium uncinatum]